MIIKKDIFNDLNIDLTVLGVHEPHKALFIDIETTGLSARSSSIYMIGLTSLMDKKWTFTGLFAENPAAEKDILLELIKILKDYNTLIHFNGNRFDLPFIRDRAKANGLAIEFNDYESIDLYKRINRFKNILGLGNCKQKTIESFLGINREDKYNGGQLIDVYKEYCKTSDEDLFDLLYQHNHDDLLGMLNILPVFIYEGLSDIPVTFVNSTENEYKDFHGNLANELLLTYSLPLSLPAPVSLNRNGIFCNIKKDQVYLRIPLHYMELKHFFADYKNYYYLPKEDMAIHKAVAEYVDKDHRQKAKKDTCYIKKMATFIPSYLSNDIPVFKADYKADTDYIEYNDKVINNKELLEEYLQSFLKTI